MPLLYRFSLFSQEVYYKCENAQGGYAMEPINLKIGEKLKSLRNTRSLSLDDVVTLTSVSKPMLGQIERGQSVPTVTTPSGKSPRG